MNDLIQDLSILTTIGKYNLDSLCNKSISVISHCVEESLRESKTITSIDVGIGTLHIQHLDNELKYKFIPSKKLDEVVCSTYKNRKSALSLELDIALGERIKNTYKDLF